MEFEADVRPHPRLTRPPSDPAPAKQAPEATRIPPLNRAWSPSKAARPFTSPNRPRQPTSKPESDRLLGEKTLKNIARPVRAYAINAASLDIAHVQRVPQPGEERRPRLSIVVLPLANLGGDPEQEYFVDGVTESLTTDVSRIAGSFVIARNTAFAYKGKAFDVKQIGRDLNVRYALEGSVQRRGDRMRINVQLIDTESGGHLWVERFDKPATDFFDMQDEIVASLANQLDTQLIANEARRGAEAPNPDSMDFYFQGMVWRHKGVNPGNLERARGYFERALALDTNNLEALVGMASVDTLVAALFTADGRAARLVAADAALTKSAVADA